MNAAPDGGTAQYRPVAVGLIHWGDSVVTGGRLTVDVSGLAGVAEVVWPDNCTPDNAGTVAVCDTGDVPDHYDPRVQLRVRAVADATAGAHGVIEYSAEATGPDGTLTAYENEETVVTVDSGPDLGVGAPQDITGVAPGAGLTVPFSVTNTGNETAHGFDISVWASFGLDIVTRYPGCTYTDRVDDGVNMSFAHLTCSFDTEVLPGATVELPEPLRLAVTSHALRDRFDYEVEPAGGATDLDTSDNSRSWHIEAANTADFAVKGTEVSGAADDTVTAAFRFVNNGPAWVGSTPSGDRIVAIDFYLPEGTAAASIPATCHDAWTSGDTPGIGHYTCTLPTWTKPDLDVSFPFELRILQVVPDATGRVVIRPYSDEASLAFDPDTTNNSAEVVVNPSL
ncbi:hypothetical protein ACFYXJ_35835 [Streptomyces sp. NPDC002667]|uniref:hypothetical protein n=1 Tax=Streptomyces sp. NPDC002667 TaxID=3364657 RepID=UPI0036A8D7D1